MYSIAAFYVQFSPTCKSSSHKILIFIKFWKTTGTSRNQALASAAVVQEVAGRQQFRQARHNNYNIISVTDYIHIVQCPESRFYLPLEEISGLPCLLGCCDTLETPPKSRNQQQVDLNWIGLNLCLAVMSPLSSVRTLL